MPLNIRSMLEDESTTLSGRRVFLSASIPDPSRWKGSFDALAITDAVVSAARAFLTSGAAFVSAAHPTIAPLILYVANEFPKIDTRTSILIYQSRLFEDVLPKETHELAKNGRAELLWTDANLGDEPQPGKSDKSLWIMREEMLRNSDPVAAIFVGGMEGIPDELRMFRDIYPDRPTYPVARPGGAAGTLMEFAPKPLQELLSTSNSYPFLFQTLVEDIKNRQNGAF